MLLAPLRSTSQICCGAEEITSISINDNQRLKNVMHKIKLVNLHGISNIYLFLNREKSLFKKGGETFKGHSVLASNHQTQFQFSPSNLKKLPLFLNLENIDGTILC